MHSSKLLSANYQHQKILDLSSSRTALWLNLAAIPLLFLYGWIFSRIIYFLRAINPLTKGVWGLLSAFSGIGIFALIISIIFMLVFHELVHGAFFWIFTGERPKFALRPGYAFAAAPDWYLPRLQYVIVGLSPFVVISLLSVILGVLLPAALVPYFIYIATFNAAGALGDMIVVAWVLRQPPSVMVQDQGDKFIAFSADHD